MVRAILVALVVALGTGCVLMVGDVDRNVATEHGGSVAIEHAVGSVTPVADAECTGLLIVFGDARGPCGTEGGTISAFGAETVLGGLGSLVDGALAFFGQGPPQPIEIVLTAPGAPQEPSDDGP